MQTPNATQDFMCDDPIWVLLADLSLGDFLSDTDRREEPTAGYPFQVVQELGMPLECVETIARLITDLAEESHLYDKQDGLEFSARIRIFCQKKMKDNAIAARTTSRAYHAEQAMEHSPMILDFGTKMKGGWGCFLIKRGGNVSADSHHLVDLYLYSEG